MPDLPLDTLIIVGLVLASLIGRLFQKKDPPKANPQESSPEDSPSDEENSLEDILRKAWPGEEELEQEALDEELVSQAEEIPQAVAPAILATPSAQVPAKGVIQDRKTSGGTSKSKLAKT